MEAIQSLIYILHDPLSRGQQSPPFVSQNELSRTALKKLGFRSPLQLIDALSHDRHG